MEEGMKRRLAKVFLNMQQGVRDEDNDRLSFVVET